MDLKKILAELEIIKLQKNETVKKLLKIMLDTDCVEIRNNIVFFLVDNFKDNDIELSLIQLIEGDRWKGCIGTLVYLLGEISSDEKYLPLLIKLILSNEIGGEVYMDCINMIISLELPLDESNVKEAIYTLDKSEVSSHLQILGLKNFLQHQLETSKIIREI